MILVCTAEYLNDTFEFRFETATWTELRRVLPHLQHICTACRLSIRSSTYSQEVSNLSFARKKMSQRNRMAIVILCRMHTTSTPRTKKSSRQALLISMLRFLLIAAYEFDRLDEFDTSSLAWNHLEVFGSKPSSRLDESFAVVQGVIYVFGGCDNITNLNRKFWTSLYKLKVAILFWISSHINLVFTWFVYLMFELSSKWFVQVQHIRSGMVSCKGSRNWCSFPAIWSGRCVN